MNPYPPPPSRVQAKPVASPVFDSLGPPAQLSPADAEIEAMIRARYPLIAIFSWEEERVMKNLAALAERQGKRVMQWTITSGLTRFRAGVWGQAEGVKGTKDPLLALREIETMRGEPTLFVLKDFHRYLTESPVVRSLRELTYAMRDSYSTLFLLSPGMETPPELEKDVTIFDYPLPGRAELDQLLDQIAAETADNPALMVDPSPEGRRALIDGALGLTINEVENVYAKTLLRRGRLSAAEAPDVYSEKRQIVRKSGLLDYIDAEESMEMVGGLELLKEWLRKRRAAFLPEARRFGLPLPKGVFILGVQGCGKSLCAKAVARLWDMPLLRLDMGRLFGSLVGSSEENVRRAIALAETIAPCALWIDEIDKGFSGLESSGASDSGTSSRVFGTLLTWLQEKKTPVFVIATANNVERLPPELLRQGRFDEIFFVDLPSAAERAEIFRIHLATRRRDPARFDLGALAAASDGYSGAEIEQVVISGLYNGYDRRRDVDQELLIEAVAETRPLSRIMADQIQARREWAHGRSRPAS